ncbi:MAG: GNAT family N-acetyltransferase [Syntrophobacteraceae bacterium]
MDHAITAEKFGVRLRPVQLQDAGFIVNLRNSPHALGFVGDSAQTEASQRDWLNEYFVRPGDYYFIIELAGNRQMVGTIGIYDIRDGSGESGRLIILPGILAAPASYWLIYHVSFDILGLDVVRGTTLESNKQVISFNKKIGIHFTGASKPRIIAGKPVNMVERRATRAEWPLISANLTRYALIAEKFLTQDDP